MDAQGHARFRRLPRLAPARRYCAPKNPLCNFRVPQNCEELRGYIEDVRLMERVREGEWRSFQPLLDLVESGVWQWREDLHSPMLSQLFRLSGTVFSPGGIYVCPQVIENVTCIAPREPAVLSRYMNTIVAHYLVPDHKREALCFLSRLVVWPIWDWNEETHKPILDSLQDATGVVLTLDGPFHLSRGTILEDALPSEPPSFRRGDKAGPSQSSPDDEGQGSTNQGASTTTVAASHPDDLLDACHGSRHL
jgi:hypothetical protein